MTTSTMQSSLSSSRWYCLLVATLALLACHSDSAAVLAESVGVTKGSYSALGTQQTRGLGIANVHDDKRRRRLGQDKVVGGDAGGVGGAVGGGGGGPPLVTSSEPTSEPTAEPSKKTNLEDDGADGGAPSPSPPVNKPSSPTTNSKPSSLTKPTSSSGSNSGSGSGSSSSSNSTASDGDSSNSTATTTSVSLLEFNVTYDPETETQSYVLNSLHDTLYQGFLGAYPNTLDVVLHAPTTSRTRKQRRSLASSSSDVTMTLQGQVEFDNDNSIPSEPDVQMLQTSLLQDEWDGSGTVTIASAAQQAPSNSNGSGGGTSTASSSSSNAGLIGGVVAAVLVVLIGLVAVLFVGRRHQNRQQQRDMHVEILSEVNEDDSDSDNWDLHKQGTQSTADYAECDIEIQDVNGNVTLTSSPTDQPKNKSKRINGAPAFSPNSEGQQHPDSVYLQKDAQAQPYLQIKVDHQEKEEDASKTVPTNPSFDSSTREDRAALSSLLRFFSKQSAECCPPKSSNTTTSNVPPTTVSVTGEPATEVVAISSPRTATATKDLSVEEKKDDDDQQPEQTGATAATQFEAKAMSAMTTAAAAPAATTRDPPGLATTISQTMSAGEESMDDYSLASFGPKPLPAHAKWIALNTGTKAQEEYNSDNESQFTYDDVGSPSVLSIPSTTPVIGLLPPSTTNKSFSDNDSIDDIMGGPETRSSNMLSRLTPTRKKNKKQTKNSSPTSIVTPLTATGSPASIASSTNVSPTPHTTSSLSSLKLLTTMNVVRSNDGTTVAEDQPFDEVLEDENDLEGFAAELEKVKSRYYPHPEFSPPRSTNSKDDNASDNTAAATAAKTSSSLRPVSSFSSASDTAMASLSQEETLASYLHNKRVQTLQARYEGMEEEQQQPASLPPQKPSKRKQQRTFM